MLPLSTSTTCLNFFPTGFWLSFKGQLIFRGCSLMGKESTKGEENGDCKYKESRKMISMPYLMIFFLSLLICVTGGSLFGWWLYKYHPTNRQLWMVPFSLILLFTPLLIWLSLLVSELCISNKSDEEQVSKVTRRIHPFNHSVCDPKQIVNEVSIGI